MPSLERIEQFHQTLAQLGNEPEIVAERGEIIEPPSQPESGIDDDLSALLGDAEADSEIFARQQAEAEAAEPEAEEEDADQDTSALLANLDDLFNDEEEEDAAEAPDDDPFGSLDLGDDDFPVPPDFTFDPDSIPDEIPEDEINAALESVREPQETDTDTDSDIDAGASLDDLGAELDEDLGDLGSELGDLDTGPDTGLDTDLGDLDSGLEDLGTDLEDLDADLGDLGTDLDTDLGDLGADLEGLDTGLDTELGDLDSDPGDLEDLDTDLGGLDTDLGDLDTDLGAGLDTDLDTDLDTGLDDLDTDLGDLDADLGAGLDTDLEDLGAELDTDLDTGLDDLDTDPGDLEDLGTDLGDLEPDLGDLGDLDDLGDLSGLDDLSLDTELPEDLSSDDDAGAVDDLADAEDLDADLDSDLDDFDDGFGAQVDSEFGDDPLDDGDDPFELPSVDEDLESLEEEGFSLGDFGEEFDIDEDSIDEFAGLEVDDSGLEDVGEDLSQAPDQGLPADRTLSDTEFSHLQQTLNALPLNVKIATEEAIARSQGTPEQINELIDALIAGASPTAVAGIVSKITGTRLQVPKGYQKRTGLAFEEERRSFRYWFLHVALPFLRVAVLTLAAVALVGFLSYRFVYRPIHAAVLYRQGYSHAQEDRFVQANETFDRAWSLWPRTRWFARYARVFVEKRQYELAVEKYDQLVFGMDPDRRAFLRDMTSQGLLVEPVRVDRRGRATTVYDMINVDREGILEHALLQSQILANFQRADELYSILIYGNDFDYDGLMGRGDNFLRWAEEDPARFEDARLAYADLLAGHGDTDAILMRFLRYFVRTGNRERVDELVDIFERRTPDAEIHPGIYAETAGFLLDHGVRTDVRNMLLRSFRMDPDIPEIHFHLARYNRLMQAATEERNALDNAQSAFARAEPLSRRLLRMQIDTDIRSAEFWWQRNEVIRTVEDSDSALRRYEEARDAGLLGADPVLARVYSVRGKVEYYSAGDLPRALSLFNRAAAEGYRSEDLDFRRGFIAYELERFDDAIEHFYAIGSSNALEGPENLIYARANTLFRRGNYVAAEAMYRRLLRTLHARRDRIQNLLVGEDPEHRALIEYLYRVHNNLGVTLYRRTEVDTTRPELLSEALVELQQSAEIAENYLRDEDTGQRPLARNLAYLNIRGILNPTGDYRPQIFQRLPRDMDQVLF